MRLFCFKDHSKAPEPPEAPRDLKQELLEARAVLASMKLRPIGSFKRHNPYINGMILEYEVDVKDKYIALQKAKIAELRVLVKAVKT